ncbi:hypothetical protein ACFYNO_39775 [Kitasatospora sp. NPDC006697]|uniref:hypothetical protein n=1 Tax=Kitasatospora sp. NPDC006697 TaxID=3364020 RepID=UPI0036A3FBAF
MPRANRLASTATALALASAGLVLGGGAAHAATAPHALQTAAASCSQAYLPLPDSSCTPGVTNPDVTPDNIQSTICVSGYSGSIRPPVSYTNALKVQQIAAYGYSDTNTADYEEDHFIPLSLGGSPTDPGNLWPQPRYSVNGYTSADKDTVEFTLYRAVCNGTVDLTSAQNAIATDWTTAASVLGLG